MNVLSLFDGMSCGQIALERAGIKVDKYYASEIKEHAIKVTQSNYPNTIQLGDVTKIKASDLPKIDLLVGGSPCQDFSQANKERKGLDGEKSGLFFQYLRLLKELKPKYFLLENVKMKKEHQDIISYYLGVEPININSKIISGQLRNRFYWTNIRNIEPLKDKGVNLSSILSDGYTDRLKSRALLESDSRPLSTSVKMFHRYYAKGFTTVVFKDKNHYNECKLHYEQNYKGLSANEIDDNLVDNSVYDGLRYLNQNELERLQTIPHNYTKELDRNDAACLLGDGWTVDVIAHIFKGLKDEDNRRLQYLQKRLYV
jgi:DNA (cytosine-5)-methyltransferase 3A